jgi:hypothetical protein
MAMRRHRANDAPQERPQQQRQDPARERDEVSPWHFAIAVEEVSEEGQHVDIVADPEVRAALARLAGLRELPRLEAHFELTPSGAGGLHVVGHVSAIVGQTCVVTLEPISNAVEEDIDLLFVAPAAAPAADGARPRAEVVEDGAADAPEPLIGGSVDLGALASEFLLLGLDPYPRKPGAVFEAPREIGAEEGGPFAALAGLRKGRDEH